MRPRRPLLVLACIVCGERFAQDCPTQTLCSPACKRERKRRVAAAWYADPENRARQIRRVVAAKRRRKGR